MRQQDKEAYLSKKRIRGEVTPADLKKAHSIKKYLRKNGINTVCEKAKCPNITRCFAKPTATFIILGNACTRNCAFCAVESAKALPVEPREPRKIARAARRLKLDHVVITSVTRDDLTDKGVSQFAKTVREVRTLNPQVTIELLTPDFHGNEEGVDALLDGIDIFGHNIEMARRLYPKLRGESDYDRSLKLLRRVKELRRDGVLLKSALMLGHGERREEILGVLEDLRRVGCDIVVIGQYLQPTKRHTPVKKYITAEEFKFYEKFAYSLGFIKVHSFAHARSSYSE